MDNEIYIIGGSGHAFSVKEVAEENSKKILGYIDFENKNFSNLKFINEGDFLQNCSKSYFKDKPNCVLGVGTIFDCKLRKSIILKYKSFVNFITLISTKSIIGSGVEILPGTVIMPGACLRTLVKIGYNCLINTMAVVEHECLIGNNCHIGPGAILCGRVKIEDDVFIGAGTIIFPGKIIKAGSTIPAGHTIK